MPQGHTKLPDYVAVGQFPRTPLRDLFTAASADTLNLLSKCIIYEPRKRISARDVRNPSFLSPRVRALTDKLYRRNPFVVGPRPPLLLRTPLPNPSLETSQNRGADRGCFPTARRSRRERR